VHQTFVSIPRKLRYEYYQCWVYERYLDTETDVLPVCTCVYGSAEVWVYARRSNTENSIERDKTHAHTHTHKHICIQHIPLFIIYMKSSTLESLTPQHSTHTHNTHAHHTHTHTTLTHMHTNTHTPLPLKYTKSGTLNPSVHHRIIDNIQLAFCCS